MAQTGHLTRAPAAADEPWLKPVTRLRIIILVAIIGTWELVAASGWLLRDVVPSILTIGRALVELLAHPDLKVTLAGYVLWIPAFYWHLYVTVSEVAVGLVIGGTTGLAGVVATIWCQLRGGPRDQQRAVFQPVGVASFVMCGAWLGGRGEIPPDTYWLIPLGLPALIAGCWLGWKLYGRLDEAQFRKIVLILLLVSGAVLVFGR